MSDARGEFDRIARYFAPLAAQAGLGLTDDAAVFAPPPGRELVVTADAMVEGVHFMAGDPPDLIARKLLRVNLSDLAGMGAAPLYYWLTLAVPRETPASWFAEFAQGLAHDQAAFGIALAGGDSSSTAGPVSLSLTAIGHVAPGTALRRNGARAGDGVWLTGTIGEAALGLRARQGRMADPGGTLAQRYLVPEPRMGMELCGIVSAAMDVSDGLVQDAGHIARASGVRVIIEAARVPLPSAARAATPALVEICLTGGDDYELLLTVPADRENALLREMQRAAIPVAKIGRCEAGKPTVTVFDAAGNAMAFARAGWQHF